MHTRPGPALVQLFVDTDRGQEWVLSVVRSAREKTIQTIKPSLSWPRKGKINMGEKVQMQNGKCSLITFDHVINY